MAPRRDMALDGARRRGASLLRAADGNAAIEFGLITPILVALILGLLDGGRAVYASMAVQSAARAGVQYAAAMPTDTAGIRQTAVQSIAAQDDPDITVTSALFCECSGGGAADCTATCPSGETLNRYVSVVVQRPFATLVPYPGLPSPMSFEGRAIFRVH